MPGNRQTFSTAMNAADRYRWDSQWAEAAKEYQRALAEFPDDAAARGGLGFCHMQTKQWKQALDEYEYILKQDPSNVIALSKTAELYVILSRREDAYRAYLHLAELYSQAGQGARAEATWQKAVQLLPNEPQPHESLATYYAGKKDFTLMVQERLAAAQGYLLRNDKAAAQAQCEEVLRVDGANAQAQQLLSQMRGQEQPSGLIPQGTGGPSGPLVQGGNAAIDKVSISNFSGGNTGIMGNMGSAGNFTGGGNPGPAVTAGMTGGGMPPTPRKRITASQVTGVLRQAQTFQTQGRFPDAVDLCEQIIESGFDRPDARYFLGWLYQEQRRWDDAIRQFQTLLNDPDYALSCYYALGQCYRAKNDLRTATMHFDEAVDRVNLDALTAEESDQLVQLCQEAAEAHRLLGEQEQALTVYNALLGFLRSRGWNDKVAQVEFMLKQVQNTPLPTQRPASTPLPPVQQANATRILPPEQTGVGMTQQPQAPMPAPKPPSSPLSPTSTSSLGELPDWLTGILNDNDKTQIAMKQSGQLAQAAQPIAPPPMPAPEASPSWLTEGASPTRVLPPEQQPTLSAPPAPPAPVVPVPVPAEQAAPAQPTAIMPPAPVEQPTMQAQPVVPAPLAQGTLVPAPEPLFMPVNPPAEQPARAASAEDLLAQMAGSGGNEGLLKNVSDTLLASTSNLPENVRVQVVKSMQDIQSYIDHGLLTPATEECLKVIDIAPQYLDIHQVLCEIYVRQGKIEQAITKYGILIERSLAAESYLRLGYMDRALTELEQALQESPTSVPTRLNYALALQKLGRTQQAVAEYQRVLQVDPFNITALVRWHIAMITGVGSNRASTLEILSRIRWQLRGDGQKHYEAVIREYSQAAETYPNNFDVRFAQGQLHQQSGNYDLAINAYQFAIRDTSYEVLARASAAQCLLAQGKPEAAIQQLEHALQSVRSGSRGAIDPTVWAARPREQGEEHQAPEVEISLMLAKAYGRIGKQEQMQAILRQVKKTTTYTDEVTSALAEISARRGDIDSALEEYADLVRSYRDKRQTDNALSVLREMIRLAPHDARPHAEVADIYISRGLLEDGISELRLLADIYLRLNKLEEASETLQRLGSIYAETGNADDAFMNFRRAVELMPDNMDLLREVVSFCWRVGRTREATEYQQIIARHYFETRQVKESVAALQQLIAIDRSNFDAYDMLGQTYQSVGEYEQASRVYKNLAKAHPGDSTAKERLAALQGLRAHMA